MLPTPNVTTATAGTLLTTSTTTTVATSNSTINRFRTNTGLFANYNQEHKFNFLKNSAFAQLINIENELQDFANGFHYKHIVSGQIIFNEGEYVDTFDIVVQGYVLILLFICFNCK